MRARYPDTEGFVERDGVKVAYEVFGSGPPTLAFVPIDPLVHSRAWRAQVPYLAREFQVITIDPRGNGRSDRPGSGAAAEIGRPVSYRPVETDGAARAAALLAELV